MIAKASCLSLPRPWALAAAPQSHFPPRAPAVVVLPKALALAAPPEEEVLTARERRKLRNERRESKAGAGSWREEVEERLLVKPKKRYATWTEELNLDNLADGGALWWVVRVSRVNGQETAERLARAFIRVYPEMEFKVYNPAVQVKRKLKNGSISVKSKPIFPGCVFLYCILNKEIHDFVRECDGIGGFLGSRVGNTKRQINRPRPVAADEMETIFRQAKEEQEAVDKAYEEEHQAAESSLKESNGSPPTDIIKGTKSKAATKLKRRTKKNSETAEDEESNSLIPGSNVRVLSGPFMEYTGRLKELNHKSGKATVGFMLFGKESFVELNLTEVVAEKT